MATAATFTDRLRVAALPGTQALVGVEHEYSLQFLGQPADFRQIIHSLSIPGRRLDPGDLNAYRLRSGMALTCDEAEAEVATPPVAIRPGFVREIENWARFARSELQAVLPPDHTLEGYSTHVSVSIPDDRPEIAQLYARCFGPSLALLMERPESLGIYIRPRPGRLELCADFVDGARLGAAVAFAAGSVRACVNALTSGSEGLPLPPRVDLELLPAVERHGLRLLRTASGCDLYALGRRALLPIVRGRTIGAQEHLELAWAAARQALGDDLSRDDARCIDDMVCGSLPLGVEVPFECPQPRASHEQGGKGPTSSEFGRIVDPIRRPGFVLAPVAATWDFTLLAVEATGGTSKRYLVVPRAHLRDFVELSGNGAFDHALRAELGSPSAGRVLGSHAQTSIPGVYDGVGDLSALLPRERDPVSGELQPSPELARAGKSAARPGEAVQVLEPASPARPGKRGVAIPVRPPTSPVAPPVSSPPRPSTGLPVFGLLAVGAFAVAGIIALVVAIGGGDTTSPGGTPTPVLPAADSAGPPVSPSAGAFESTGPSATANLPATPVLTSSTPAPTQAATAPTETATASTPSAATATAAPAASTATPSPIASPSITPAATPDGVPTAPATATPLPSTPTPSSSPTATRTVEPTVRPTSTPVPIPTSTPPPVPTRLPPATVIAATVPAPAPGCTPVPGTVCP